MDGNEAVQRATTWWESLNSDAAWSGPEILAGLITDLAQTVEENSEPTVTKVSGLLSGLGGLVQAGAQNIAQELGSMAKSNRHSLLRAAEALRHRTEGGSVDRFRMVFDNAAVAIAVATGEIDGKIVEVNPAFAEMFRTSTELLRGVSISRFADIEKIGAEMQEWVGLLRDGGGTRRFEAP